MNNLIAMHEAMREKLRGHHVEYAAVSPCSPWYAPTPVVIAEGDWHSASYDRKKLLFALPRDVKHFGFGHSHPRMFACLPSFGDLQDCASLQVVAEAHGLILADYLIVDEGGKLFSYAAAGILEDPLGPCGLAYAKQGLREAYAMPYRRGG
jgi:hypothetical protein